jgi:hypothetical protein
MLAGGRAAGNTFAWLAFRSAQPRPVRLAHHTHAAAQVITAVRWHVPTLVVVRSPADSALAHMVLRGASARSALVAWIRFHRRIMTVREGFVAAGFDDVTHDFGAVVQRVNKTFATDFGVFEHTGENEMRVFDEITERNRLLRGEQMPLQRALWLARPTAEREALKGPARRARARRTRAAAGTRRGALPGDPVARRVKADAPEAHRSPFRQASKGG